MDAYQLLMYQDRLIGRKDWEYNARNLEFHIRTEQVICIHAMRGAGIHRQARATMS